MEEKRKKRILFVCTANVHRSPTAEFMFSEDDRYEVRSAGVSILAKTPVTEDLLDWADVVFVMDEREEGQKSFLLKNFPMVPNLEEKITVLNIPDRYIFGSEELIKILEKRLKKYLHE